MKKYLETRRTVLKGSLAAAGVPLLGATHLSSAEKKDANLSAEKVETKVAKVLPLTGVNLASAGMGTVPGKYGTNYVYPQKGNVDYYSDLGFNLIRLPFRWERLQPKLNAPFDSNEKARLASLVEYVTSKEMHIVLDVHNYARRRLLEEKWATLHLIGSPSVPNSAFYDFWIRLAEIYSDNPRVIFGLMNEPFGIDAKHWMKVASGAISSIRSTNAKNLILIPGVHWSGAATWLSSGNAILSEISDPAENSTFEVHQYFDADSSGTNPNAVSVNIGVERIQAFQEWSRANGFKAFLGEFNGASDEVSCQALRNICQEMAMNSDVWMGWAAWAGGPWWPDHYMFNLEPHSDGRHRVQTMILASYAAR